MSRSEKYYGPDFNALERQDPEIAAVVISELVRQRQDVQLIASENFTSAAVLATMGSTLSNKYTEGYPGKRYYGGCEEVDKVEVIGIERAKKLFGAEHANVQPHAGSGANMAAYFALLQPKDVILSMKLSAGGHLTHGHPVNFSGQLYTIIGYGVNQTTQQLDYDEIEKLVLEHRPKMIVAGASSYSRFIDFKRFREIADRVGAYLLIDMAHIAGLVAAGVHPSPVPYADIVTFTTHKTFKGPRGAVILCKEKYAQAIDKAVMPGTQGGAFAHVIAAKAAACIDAFSDAYKQYQKQVVINAKAMADRFAQKGYTLIAGGTDNHLFLLDVSKKGLSGKQVEEALEFVGIYINRNAIPFDTKSPFITSGIRIGTPALTTRGINENQCIQVADMIDEVMRNIDNQAILQEISGKVKALAQTLRCP